MASLARSVHHAHERGILHCDLKPGNILMNREGGGELPAPVITDFGMARILTEDSSQTRTLNWAGTPLYMSPEQARGERRSLTARTDVYALGVILYELLTGLTPFPGDSGPEILKRVQGDPTPCVGAANSDVPRDLRAICRRCLEKDSQDRYASAAALAEDLDRFLGGYPVEARKLNLVARAAKWTRRNPIRTAAAVAFAGLIVGFGLLLAEWWSARIRHAADLRVAEADLKLAKDQQRGAEQRAKLGDFTTTFAKIQRRRDERHPDWPTLNQADFQRLSVPTSIVDLAPVRTEIAAALGGVDLGTPRVIAQGFKAYNPAFSPDGKTLALGSWLSDDTGMCSVLLIDVETGAVRKTLRYEADRDWEKRYAQQQGKPPGCYDGCRALIFRPRTNHLVLGTRSGWLVRWNVNSKNTLGTRWGTAPYNTAHNRINNLAFALGYRLLVVTDDRSLSSWDASHEWELSASDIGNPLELVRPARAGDPLWVKDGRNLRQAHLGTRWLGQRDPFQFHGSSAVAAPGGELLFGIQNDGTIIRQYARYPDGFSNFEEYVAPFTVPGEWRTEEAAIDDMFVSPDGQFLATSTEHTRHLKLWSVTTNHLLSNRSLDGGSLRLAFSPDSRTLAVCEKDRTLLYPVLSSGVSSTQALQTYEILDAAVDQDEVALLCRYRENYAVGKSSFIAQRISLTGTPGWASASVTHFDFQIPVIGESRIAIESGGGSFAYVRGDDVVWLSPDWTGGPHVFSATPLRDIQFGPGRRLWIAAANTLVGRGADGWKRRITFTDEAGGIPPFASRIAVDRDILLAGRSDGIVDCIDPNTGKVKRSISLFDDKKITAIALVGDGVTAIAGSVTGAVQCFNYQNGDIVVKLPTAHLDSVHSIAVGPRGWFATASQDRHVKIWNPAGQEVLTLPQSRPVRRVYWSKDGTRLTILNDCERGLKQWNIDRLKESFEKLGIPSMLP